MKGIRYVLLMVVFLWMVTGTVLESSASQPALRIEMNGRPIVFGEVNPFIDENNRTMVPVRFVSEELGAEVFWDGESQAVTIKQDYDVIQLWMNNSLIWINGEYRQMDTKMVLNREHNRNYVPLRFVSQGLGASVEVDDFQDGMLITITQDEKRSFTGIESISIGDSEANVLETLGTPDRKELTPYGYQWWVYGSDGNSPYRLVGVQSGTVVTSYTDDMDWSYQGVGVGTSMDKARQILGIQNQITFRVGPVQYRFNQNINLDENESDYFILDDNAMLILYYDIHENHTVTAARFVTLSLVPKFGNMDLEFEFPSGHKPDLSLPFLSPEEKEVVRRGNEQIMFDLVNSIRRRKDLPELEWHEGLREVAYLHSVDMSDNQFFSHQSSLNKGPGERVKASDIPFESVRENIAMGQMDAIKAHQGLMNSLGHRENILNRQVDMVGIGVFELYYTQKYMK